MNLLLILQDQKLVQYTKVYLYSRNNYDTSMKKVSLIERQREQFLYKKKKQREQNITIHHSVINTDSSVFLVLVFFQGPVK